MKKIISVLMAIAVLVLFVLPCFVSAAEEPTFEVSSVSVNAGEDVDVKIDIKNNPGITSAKLKVAFDDALTLKSVTYGKLEGLTQQPQELKSPVVLNWINGKDDLKGDMEYAVLTFTADKAASGKYDVSLYYDEEDVYNLKEENIKFNTVAGTVTVTGGDSASDVLTIGAEEHDDGDGNYIGEEEILEFEDENGNLITEEDAPGKKVTPIWIFAVLAAIVIVAAVVVVIAKKRAFPKED